MIQNVFRGMGVALITPFKKNGDVDFGGPGGAQRRRRYRPHAVRLRPLLGGVSRRPPVRVPPPGGARAQSAHRYGLCRRVQ